MTLRTLRHTSLVDAAAADVWRRVTSFDGINAELGPVLRMRTPPALRDATLATVPLGVPLGRAWILLCGVLPVEYDDLMLTEVEQGSHFQEVSSMLSMHRWEHRREVRPIDARRTEVTDIVGFEPRVPLLGGLFEGVLRALFAHRHRRLARAFA